MCFLYFCKGGNGGIDVSVGGDGGDGKGWQGPREISAVIDNGDQKRIPRLSQNNITFSSIITTNFITVLHIDYRRFCAGQKYSQRRKMCRMQVREVKCALHQIYQIRNLGWSPCIIFILLNHLCTVKVKQHYLTFLINFFCKSAVCMSRQGLCHSIRIVIRILLSDISTVFGKLEPRYIQRRQ